jgi:hypothetical protein
MADLRIDIASEFTGAKAFKKADSATSSLDKGVAKLGKTLAATFAVTKVLQFGKASAKAFLEDEAAATRLAQSVKNLGLAYASNDIRKYIDSLTLATGVADSELRPALQSLLQVTGSVTKSQQLLSQAIDVSRGSGVALTTVAKDLSQAYVGNTRGLRKYDLGLTKAELAAASFVDVQARMNKLFAGASTAYLTTYAGQMQVLANTAAEAQEVIGKDLVDALILASGQDGVENLATQMSDLATFTGDAIYGLGVLIDKLNNLGGLKQIGGLMGLLQLNPITGIPLSALSALADLGRSSKAAKNTFNFASGGGMGAADTSRVAAEQSKKAEAAARKREKERAALLAKNTKAIKEQTALQKAGTLFDVEQTQIIAALKGKISEDERKRLELQLALLTGNTSEASKLAGEIGKAQGLSAGLIAYLKNLPDAKNPFAGWAAYLDAIEAQVKRIALGGTSMGTSVGGTIAGASMTGAIPGSSQVFEGDFGNGGAAGAPVTPQVNVQVTLDGQELTNAITRTQTNNSLSGDRIAINRRTGTFATL